MIHEDLSPDLVEHVFQLISKAEYILIGAGAGMSADAGLDYHESEQFLHRYPYLRAVGVHCRYHSIGFEWPTKTMQWAFYARHLEDILYSPPPCPDPYLKLKALTGHADRFVLTSNADNLFPRSGFDPASLWTRQGTYANLQCIAPCCEQIWDSKPYVERLLPHVDLKTGELDDAALLPQCPYCEGEMMLNVRGGSWFVEKPLQAEQSRFSEWRAKAAQGRLLVIEIGAGFSTPSVVRWPCEAVVMSHPDAHLIRVNCDFPEVHRSLDKRSTAIAVRGASLIGALSLRDRDAGHVKP